MTRPQLFSLLIFASATAGAGDIQGIKAPDGHPLPEIISGYEFRNAETQAVQDDEFENPGYLWVEQGAELWETVDGKAGRSCSSCHNDAADSMTGVGAQMPKWNEKLGKPVNLEQQVNRCRSGAMQAEPWKFDSEELKAMTTYVRNQSHGMPVEIDVSGPMQSWFERGKEIYYTRHGQLDMACASCHENYGKQLRSDHLSQGQSNGFPTYRLKTQGMVSLHNRFKGCMRDVRAQPYAPLSDEFLALEVYLAWRGQGLTVETPAVRH